MKFPVYFPLLVGATLVLSVNLALLQLTRGQEAEPAPAPFEGADSQIVADFQLPAPNPLSLSRAFIEGFDASITPSLSIAELILNPVSLTDTFIGNDDASVAPTLSREELTLDPTLLSHTFLGNDDARIVVRLQAPEVFVPLLEEIVEKFKPVLYLHNNENYEPQEIQVALDTATLRDTRFINPDKPISPPLTVDDLASRTQDHYELDFPDRTFRPGYFNLAYAHVTKNDDQILLQYWFFYYFNDWEGGRPISPQHEGDWEFIQLE